MASLEEMHFFVEVVKHGNFTSAAQALGISKQLVSRRIIALEARLGVRLLLCTTWHAQDLSAVVLCPLATGAGTHGFYATASLGRCLAGCG